MAVAPGPLPSPSPEPLAPSPAGPASSAWFLLPYWGWLLPLLGAIGTWVLYLPHVCPVLFIGDSGELITAAWTNGIAHPPGYPLYVILLGLWLKFPWTSPADWEPALFGPAYGGNLFSLFCAVLAVAALIRLLWQLSGHAGWALLGGLLFALTPTFFSQALIAEVYTLQVLLVALWLLALERLVAVRAPGWLLCLALLQGLLLANHPAGLLLLPASLAAAGWYSLRYRLPPGIWWLAAILLLAGPLLYLSLPLRSLQNPWLDWGNPERWTNFWRVIRREEYAQAIASYTGGGIGFGGQVRRWAHWTWEQYGWLLVPLGLGMVLALRRRDAWSLLAPLAFACVTVPYWWYFRNIPVSETVYLEVYYLPAHLVLLVWGLSGYLPAHGSGPAGRGPILLPGWQVLVLAMLMVGVQLRAWPQTIAHESRATSQIGARFAVTTLRSLPDQAVLVTEGDELFLYWYLQAVCGMKPGIVLAETASFSDTQTWYWESLKARHPDLAIPDIPTEARFASMGLTGVDQRKAWVIRMLARTNTARPVYLTGTQVNPRGGGFGMNWAGLLFYLTPERDETLDVTLFTRQELQPPGDLAWLLRQQSFDFYEERLKAKYLQTLRVYGSAALAKNKLTEAERLFDFILQIDSESWEVYRELGIALLLREDWERAGEVFTKLSRHDSQDALAPYALAVVHYRLGDLRAARMEAARAKALDPDNRLVERELESLTRLLEEEALRQMFREADPEVLEGE